MNYILVAGYGWTGSSALVDMLKEYETCYEPSVEFRLIKDPKGIRDLYNSITQNWDPLNVDIAIRDFIWFVKHLYYKSTKMSLYSGLGYKDFFGDVFVRSTKRFIGEIVDFKYESHWWYLDFMKNKPQMLKTKIIRKVANEHNNMFFSDISSDEFIALAQEYIDSLFRSLKKEVTIDSIILDQAVSAQNCSNEMCFVPNSKTIIVDRDPRDIYADLMKDGNLIGKELQVSHSVDKYISWHKALRKTKDSIKSNPDVMFISFEDLVGCYDETEAKIEEFLKLDHKKHINRQGLFKPSISAQNVGIWKKQLHGNEIKCIEKELVNDLVQ